MVSNYVENEVANLRVVLSSVQPLLTSRILKINLLKQLKKFSTSKKRVKTNAIKPRSNTTTRTS